MPTPTRLEDAELIENYRSIISQAPLKKVPRDETQRSLGFYFNMNDPAQSLNKKVHDKVNDFVSKIVTRRLSSHDIIRALYHIHVPSIFYVFHSHNETGDTREREFHRLSSTILPLIRLNRHIPLKLRYAPLSRGGFGLPNLFCEMVLIKIKQVLRKIRKNTEAGQLMLIALQWTQKLTGSGIELLREVNYDIDYIENNWWLGVRLFLRRINGQIQFETSYVTPPNFLNDRAIMDDLGKLNLGTKKMKILNNVRLYKKVTYLSDIIHPQEPYLLPCYLDDTEYHHSSSTLIWPTVAKPTNEESKIWARHLAMLYTISPTKRLKQEPSRIWLPVQERSRIWKANFGLNNGQPIYLRAEISCREISEVKRRHLIVSNIETSDTFDEVTALEETTMKWDNTTRLSSSPPVEDSSHPCLLMVTDGSVKYVLGGG